MKRYFLFILIITLGIQSYGQGLIIDNEENKPNFASIEKLFFFKEKTRRIGRKPILYTAEDSLAIYLFKKNRIITIVYVQDERSINYALEFMNISDTVKVRCHRNQKKPIITNKNDDNDSIMGLEIKEQLIYSHLWNGVEVVFQKNKTTLNCDFHIAPYTEPKVIQFRITNAINLEINDAGMLEIITPLGVFQKNKPTAYQKNGNEKVIIESHYKVEEKIVHFQIGAYDSTKKLVISNIGLLNPKGSK